MRAQLVHAVSEQAIWVAPDDRPAPFPNGFQFRPTAARMPVALRDSQAELSALGVGGYHLLYAQARGQDERRWHVAAVQYFSQPGPAPRGSLAWLAQQTAIVPEILPREHSHVMTGTTWRYRVLRQGVPVPGASVALWLPNSEPQTFTADAEGWVAVRFPDALPLTLPGRHGQPAPLPFVLATLLGEEGISWTQTLTEHRALSRSPELGWGVLAGVSALTAWVSLRRSRLSATAQGSSHDHC